MKLVGEEEHYHVLCRSPQGERGLKQHVEMYMGSNRLSLPARGAWVETLVARAWGKLPIPRRSPQGERGLKQCLVYNALRIVVAPRKGSVG